ncbi:RnfABCDGE type electron transport complex subunit G [Pseudodesulfovibrio thermohalotolerans]|uniref:RnfABCDGE type electron transport complex subunit G n=1 Tax=Pseudodesulfovibrio thermohalotolerans TaxID=2880651 RepID=UPI002440EF20|nr:RnfABCDGE type electron transport complex subunit G [Pseudodesulfovibrio thermohalotolerans]WFS63465.1 RnfABCDGE type electron transport complex subunit G [Pseudodesulfovibrio thermohalotolerans]
MREILHMLVVLSLICAASGTILVNLKQATKGQIEQQVLTYVQGPALMSVLKDCDNDPIAERKQVGDVTVFPAKRDGKLVGVALETFAPGYSGDIGVIVGFELDQDRLLGIGVTTQTETPGLGTKVAKPAFTKQFTAHGLDSMDLASRGGDIDGISGATFSSGGTVDAVRKAIDIYRTIKPQLATLWQAS